MPIEPVKIPQNVYIEDRIIGPVTLRQLIMVAIGGGFSYMLWAALTKAYGTPSLPIAVMAWSPAAVSAVFAFVRINDISMTRLCLLLLERLNKPSRRTWAPRRGLTINIRTFADAHTTQAAPQQAGTRPQQLEELSTFLDTQDDGLQDPPEQTSMKERRQTDAPIRREDVSVNRLDAPAIDSVRKPRMPRPQIFRDIAPPSA